jgi:putative acyl-CoA dehydrogenase
VRAILRDPDSVDAFFAEVGLASGSDRILDKAVQAVKDSLADTAELEARARSVAERLGLLLQASLLVRHAGPAVVDAFCASRLGGDHGRAYGTLPAGTDFKTIIERATPKNG